MSGVNFLITIAMLYSAAQTVRFAVVHHLVHSFCLVQILYTVNTLISPNEVYLTLTGGGQWRVGDYDWLTLQPGETIFIPSNTVHAIRAGEPLLTFSFWLEEGAMEAIAIARR